MTSLYLIAAEYQQAAARLQDTDLDEQTILDTLDGMAGAVELKARNVAFVIRSTEALAASMKQAESDIAARRKHVEARAEHIKDYLLAHMIACGITKIECPEFQLSVRDNPTSVVIDAESQIPDDYWREIPATRYVDKTLVKQAIADGYEVPGVHTERAKRLTIK